MNVPTLIQEQNSFPGKTNIYLSKRVDRICVAYAGMDKYFPKDKLLLTGNPVRQDVVRLAGKRPRGMEHFGLSEGAPILFVTGGSLGARGVNKGIEAALPRFQEAGLQVIWQTGTPYHAQALEAVAKLNYDGCKVHEFVTKMDLAYAVADLIVSRAGAISVSEICPGAKARDPCAVAHGRRGSSNAQCTGAHRTGVQPCSFAMIDAVEELGTIVLETDQGPRGTGSVCTWRSPAWEHTMLPRPLPQRSFDWHAT